MRNKVLLTVPNTNIYFLQLASFNEIYEDNLIRVHRAIDDGSSGIVVIVNHKLLCNESYTELVSLIKDISSTAHMNNCKIKLIFESNLLHFEQFNLAFELCSDANVDFLNFRQI